MSHVDEGALHAYLDGALDEYPVADARRIRDHLDICAECAERLEVERALRSDAHVMLGMAVPSVELPSFEELRAYVERTRPAPSRMSVRVVRLSWAASVMLALGVGWALRGGRMEPMADTSRTPMAGVDRDATVFARGAVSDDGSTTAPVAEEGVGSGGTVFSETIDSDAFDSRLDLPVSSVASASLESVAGAVEAENDVVDDASGVDLEGAAVPVERASGAEGVVLATAMDADESAGRSMVADGATVPAAAPARPEAVIAEAAAAGMGATAPLGVVTDDSGASRLSEADVVAAAEPAEEEVRPERRRSESPTAFTSQFSAGRGGVRVVAEGDDRFEDEPLQAVPGFEVVLTENVGDGREFVGTVTTQRLEGEEVREGFLLDPDLSLDVLAEGHANLNEVRVPAETGWVVLRGPRSEDELETLLMRLFPG